MKIKSLVAIAAFIALAGCQDYNDELKVPSRLEVLLEDFRNSSVLNDLSSMGFTLDPSRVQLVEITQFEYLFLGSEDQVTYVVKYLREGGWEHFMKIKSQASNAVLKDLTGSVEFDFYTEGVSSVHTFEGGVQTAYTVYSEKKPRRVLTGRTITLEDCESMCHALDCAGRKFEDKNWFGKLACAESFVVCMGILVVDCISDGCSNSPVKSCNHH